MLFLAEVPLALAWLVSEPFQGGGLRRAARPPPALLLLPPPPAVSPGVSSASGQNGERGEEGSRLSQRLRVNRPPRCFMDLLWTRFWPRDQKEILKCSQSVFLLLPWDTQLKTDLFLQVCGVTALCRVRLGSSVKHREEEDSPCSPELNAF